MISAVASPATPRMPRAKVAVGARGRVSAKAAAPGICSIAGGTVPSRSVMASTNACGPDAATSCAYGSASMPTNPAKARADASVWSGSTRVLSMPTR